MCGGWHTAYPASRQPSSQAFTSGQPGRREPPFGNHLGSNWRTQLRHSETNLWALVADLEAFGAHLDRLC